MTPDFVSELYKATNEVANLSLAERRRLIERALAAIADLYEALSKEGNIEPFPTTLMSEIRTIFTSSKKTRTFLHRICCWNAHMKSGNFGS